MAMRSSRVHTAISLPHHLVVRVDEVPAPVVVSTSIQDGQILYEAGVVVDSHQAHGVVASRQYYYLLQLDTAGSPDDNMIDIYIIYSRMSCHTPHTTLIIHRLYSVKTDIFQNAFFLCVFSLEMTSLG